MKGCCIESHNASTYVIDVYNGATAAPQGGTNAVTPMSGGTRLNAIQKTALIGATLLLDFTYYQIKKDNNG